MTKVATKSDQDIKRPQQTFCGQGRETFKFLMSPRLIPEAVTFVLVIDLHQVKTSYLFGHFLESEGSLCQTRIYIILLPQWY